MECVFHKVEARFHIRNPHIYIITGVFPWDNPAQNRIQVWLDQKEVPIQIVVRETPDVIHKYMYADSEITQEIQIQIPLPDGYEQHRKLYLVTLANDGSILKKEKIRIRDILHQYAVQYHEVFECEVQENKYILHGTCMLEQPVQLRLYGDAGDIPYRISWQMRAQAECYYPEEGYRPYSDYQLTFDGSGVNRVTLEVQSGAICSQNTLILKRLRKEARYRDVEAEGRLQHLRYSLYRHWNRGTLQDACRRMLGQAGSFRTILRQADMSYDTWMKKRIPSEKKLQVYRKRIPDVSDYLLDYRIFQGSEGVFSADAEYEFAKAVKEHPEVDVIYMDEDVLDSEGIYQEPVYKPDFSPDYLRSMNYIGDCCVIRCQVLERILPMLDVPDLSVETLTNEAFHRYAHTILLKCMEESCVFYHIPRSLFHRHQRLPVNREKLRHIEYTWTEQPLVSIIIPNKDHIQELDTCIQSIETQSTYRNYEYIIIENNSEEAQTFEYYQALQERITNLTVLYYEGEFNYSRINNFGVQYAKGEYLLLLNNDTELIAPHSIWEMLSNAMRPEIGIVGVRLYFPDDTIQHAGVIVGYGGVSGHAFLGASREDSGYQNRILCMQNYSAVTAACLMVSRQIYHEVGGMSEEYRVVFNDIDFCLKVRDCGYLVLYTPYAEFYHYESKSRGMDTTTEQIVRYQQEIRTFTERWHKLLASGDPYYNVNLTLDRKDFSMNFQYLDSLK